MLSALEESVSSRKTWASPHMALDRDKQTEHLAAARESWALVTQVRGLQVAHIAMQVSRCFDPKGMDSTGYSIRFFSLQLSAAITYLSICSRYILKV